MSALEENDQLYVPGTSPGLGPLPAMPTPTPENSTVIRGFFITTGYRPDDYLVLSPSCGQTDASHIIF